MSHQRHSVRVEYSVSQRHCVRVKYSESDT